MTLVARVLAPIGSGLHRYYKPFLAPEDAFTDLEDVYVRRGLVNKRQGFMQIGRVGPMNTTASFTVSGMSTASTMVITTTAAHNLTVGQRVWLDSIVSTGGTAPYLTFEALNNSWYEVSSVPTSETFTISGAQPSNSLDPLDWVIQVISSTGFGTYTTNTANIYGSVVGLMTQTLPTSPDLLIAFDQVYGYVYSPGSGNFTAIQSSAGGNPLYTFTGANWQYFNGCNFGSYNDSGVYTNYLWVTNWNDNIAYITGNTLTSFTPQYDATSGDIIIGCRLIASFKGRLLLLNTIEQPNGGSAVSQVNRVRWSWAGSVLDSNAFNASANNGAGFADADTDEDIVGYEFNRDQLIVFFEYSTWNLRYQGNDLLPFIWERVNIQYGATSSNGVVALDQYICAAGDRGFIGATSVGVQRIDLQIPDQPFQIESSIISGNASNFRRVAAAQDYNLQQVIWTFPTQQVDTAMVSSEHVRNNQALVYNYEEKTWSTYNVNWTIPCNFRTNNELTWGSCDTTWEDASWTWGTSFGNLDKQILVVGSDSGRVFQIDDIYTQEVNDAGTTVSFGFKFTTKRFNAFLEMAKRCRVPYIDLYLSESAYSEFTVSVYTDDNPGNAVVTQTVSAESNTDTIRRVYVNGWGRNVQFQIYLTDAQIQAMSGIADFGLQGIIVWTQEAGRIVNP